MVGLNSISLIESSWNQGLRIAVLFMVVFF